MTVKHWKDTPLANCGGDKYRRDTEYHLPGWFIGELLQMAYLLSSGEIVNCDMRRDMGQRIQAVVQGYNEEWGEP